MEFERHRVEHKEVKKSSLIPIIGVSLLVHLAIGAWIFYSPTGHKAALENIEPAPIKAKLVFVDLTKFQPEPNDNVAPIEAPSIAQPQEIPEPADEVEMDMPAEEPVADMAESEPAELAVEDPRDKLPALDLPDDFEETQAQTEGSITTQSTGGRISRDLARQHLQSYQNQAIERLSAQRARQYQQQKDSPDLQIPEFDPFTTEDEKFHQARSVRVDCSTALNKTLSVLSGITGGGLKCTEGADLTPYIDKHLNKGAPASQRNNQN